MGKPGTPDLRSGTKSKLLCFDNCNILALGPFKVKVGVVPCVSSET